MREEIEGLKYQISPQQDKQTTADTDNDKDRTLALIESFLETMPAMPDNSASNTPSVPIDATTDYMAYLMQNEKPAIQPQKRTKSSKRISLEESEEQLSLPEEDDTRQEDFFTESLAQIYIKKQKYNSGLEIIRALSADNPKKNSYFADQIRFLEKIIEINNKKNK